MVLSVVLVLSVLLMRIVVLREEYKMKMKEEESAIICILTLGLLLLSSGF